MQRTLFGKFALYEVEGFGRLGLWHPLRVWGMSAYRTTDVSNLGRMSTTSTHKPWFIYCGAGCSIVDYPQRDGSASRLLAIRSSAC